MAQWQHAQYYTFLSAHGPGKYTLSTPVIELGNALLGDAEHLLNHSAEHQAMLHHAASSSEWKSSAWFLVTAYYWAFFAAQALTRLVGQTMLFLDGSMASVLAQVSGVKGGPGTYRIRPGPVTGTHRVVDVQKSKDRQHEGVWKVALKYLEAVGSTVGGSFQEVRLYSSLARAATRFGYDWPSAVRNIVNYRPGFGYRSIINDDLLKCVPYASALTVGSLDWLLSEYDGLAAKAQDIDQFEDERSTFGKLVLLTAALLHAIASDLYSELHLRGSLDRRWQNARTRFARREGLGASVYGWPFT
jgi:hypothetical protein